MTPAFQAAIGRLEGQRQNLFRRICRIRRSAVIIALSLNGFSVEEAFRNAGPGKSKNYACAVPSKK
jgi:hypothetical protein